RNPVFRLIRRLVPSVPEYHGARFTVVEAGRRYATPLLLVLVCIEATDVVFAVDSIPAIFAVTTDPFIVYTSNIFAILGLRALFFLLAGMVGRLAYLNVGLAAVMSFVGVKMLLTDVYEIPVLISLGGIASVLVVSVAASWLWPPASAAGAGACGRVSPTRDGDASGSAAAGPWIPGEGTLRAAVEARVRQLVAEQLGVAVEELGPEVSLTDDLAADSLDLLELALVLESEFAIALPQRTVDELRTCRDLVDAVMVSSNGRQRRERLTSRPLLVMARVVPARDQTAGLERVGELTPYAMEAIAEDAARAGRGARLEVTVSATADDVD